MAKRSHRSLTKKGLPGLIRGKNAEGKRVWFYNKQEFTTLRQVVEMFVRQ